MIVKVCGITTAEDAIACLEAGVDWIGLNFVPSSRRRVDVATAKTIAAAVRGRVTIVGVTADLTFDELVELRREVGLDRLQLHGDEPPELLRALGSQAFKAVRLGGSEDAALARSFPPGLMLVDAKVNGVDGALGGTGHRVDVDLARSLSEERPIVLAGGLSPDNVREAVTQVRPFGVDVASGVEPAQRPGVKDHAAIARFVSEARAA